jgi:tetratricopeptide (TPR) repeat protein
MVLAAILFTAGMFLRPGGALRSEEGFAKTDSKEKATAPAFNPATLFRETEESLRPAPPEKFREWAGELLQTGDAAAAKRLLDRSNTKLDVTAFARDLVRRGQYETAANLLEPMLRRSEDPEVALMQIACRLGLGQVDLAHRPLIALESNRGPKMKEYQGVVELVEKLIRLASSGRMLGLEHNPWNVKFLPDKSGTPAKTLPEEEAKKLPADAEQTIAKWLQIAPMQPAVWAVLGQILFVRGDPSDALECFKRAKAMGYNSPLIAEYIRLLEREEAARRSAVMSGMGSGAAPSPTTQDSAPVAMTGSSSRAIAVFGFGGLVVGFLIGVMASKRR